MKEQSIKRWFEIILEYFTTIKFNLFQNQLRLTISD